MAEYDELLIKYRKIAKVADQRLVRLERLSQKSGYESVTKLAYARAQKDIQAWTKGGTRFNTAPPKRVDSLRAKIADIEHFLESKSSTKRDITNIYERAARTTNERYGTNFTWEDMANYYNTIQSKNNDSKYGSKTLIKALAVVKNVGPDPEAIKKSKRKSTILSDDVVVDEIAHRLLKAGQTSKKLFGK